MLERMMKILEENLKHEIIYFLKYNTKSPNLSKIQREMGLDDEDFKEHCEKMKHLCNNK